MAPVVEGELLPIQQIVNSEFKESMESLPIVMPHDCFAYYCIIVICHMINDYVTGLEFIL